MMIYRNILEELGLRGDNVGRLSLRESTSKLGLDNQSAIAAFSSPSIPNSARHVKMDHNYIRDLVAEGDIDLEYVPTDRMTADFLTKALPRRRLCTFAILQMRCKSKQRLGEIAGSIAYNDLS